MLYVPGQSDSTADLYNHLIFLITQNCPKSSSTDSLDTKHPHLKVVYIPLYRLLYVSMCENVCIYRHVWLNIYLFHWYPALEGT